jgi:hypothetical protein
MKFIQILVKFRQLESNVANFSQLYVIYLILGHLLNFSQS